MSNKIMSSIEQVAESIGKDIGASYDQVQADLLNGFTDAIAGTMPQESTRQGQYYYINSKLTPTARKILVEIADWIKAVDNV
jgi:hypothetical protein